MIAPPVVDWWRLITDLQLAHGMSQRDIGQAIGCDHATINRLRNDVHASPLYVTGVRLVALWMQREGKGAADVPQPGMVRTLTATTAQDTRGNPQTPGAAHDVKPTDHHPQAGCPA